MKPEAFPIEKVALIEYGIELQPGRRCACFVHGGDNPTAVQHFPDSNTLLCRTHCGSINSVRLYAMAHSMDVTTREGYRKARQSMMNDPKYPELQQPVTAEEESQIHHDGILNECVETWHRALTPELRQALHARSISDVVINNSQIGFCRDS